MLFVLLGCFAETGGKGDATGDRTGDGAAGGVSVETVTVTSDDEGYARVPITLEEGDVFQVVAERGRGTMTVDYAYDPDGNVAFDWEDWYYSEYSLTNGIYPDSQVTFDWPVRTADGPLAAGTWEVAIATLDSGGYYKANQDVTVEVLRRAEPDPEAGTLRALVAYAGGLEEDADLVAAIEEASAYWQELYASIGVTMTVEYTTIPIDADLPSSWTSQPEVEALLEGWGERVSLLIVGDTVDGDEWLYGEAAGIPGPYTATSRSVVQIGWIANAGADGSFSRGDILLMGETMAHEVGHYLGLYHPVEDGWDYWDALDDTEECTTMRECENSLGANLMFPYPICWENCSRQDQITAGQAGVANHWVGVE